jgi:hypothetical protein
MRFVRRIRDRLLRETGIDFARYRSAALMDSLDAWAAGMRLAGDFAIASLSTFGVLAVALWWALEGDLGLLGSAIVMLGAGIASSGVGLAVWARRTIRRIPRELDKVLSVAQDLTSQVAVDLRTSAADPAQVARGLAVVTAGPMVARATAQRFLVLAPIAEPILTGVIARTLERTLPLLPVRIDPSVDRIERVSALLADWRRHTGGRIERYVSVALTPVRVIAFALAGMGVAVLVAVAVLH